MKNAENGNSIDQLPFGAWANHSLNLAGISEIFQPSPIDACLSADKVQGKGMEKLPTNGPPGPFLFICPVRLGPPTVSPQIMPTRLREGSGGNLLAGRIIPVDSPFLDIPPQDRRS